MKILIIGGTYFLGRIYTILNRNKHELTLVNRGTYDMKDVTQYHFDRHDSEGWKQLPIQDYDACIDFCAYSPGDIQTVLKHYPGTIKHYIYISTVDVYQRQTGLIKKEDHPLESRHFIGEMGDYIYHKMLLEKELVEACQQHNIHYTSLRPGNIYGPLNYAPREFLLIQRVFNKLPLYHFSDASASFQMVYVQDVVKAINLVIEKKAYDTAYNIVCNDIINYDDINSVLASIQNVEIETHSLEEAIASSYPTPYPIYKEEEELYDGHLIEALGLRYTSLEDGLKQTYQSAKQE